MSQETQKPAVLFVDDEKMLRDLVDLIVKPKLSDTVEFISTGSGAEALKIIGENRGRLIAVLTDLRLGEMSGNAVAKAALEAGVKAVAICTGSTDANETGLIHQEITDRITLIKKPFDMIKLKDFYTQAMSL